MRTRGIQSSMPSWKALYSQRQAVERAFSRLKGQRSLNHIRVRGIRKVTVHCYLSLMALQALASFQPRY
ncbi:MAG: transposase [Chloroflexi bacterium]|nr:transposase [Chloroflexota bacterium]